MGLIFSNLLLVSAEIEETRDSFLAIERQTVRKTICKTIFYAVRTIGQYIEGFKERLFFSLSIQVK